MVLKVVVDSRLAPMLPLLVMLYDSTVRSDIGCDILICIGEVTSEGDEVADGFTVLYSVGLMLLAAVAG